jgi:SAM-dependent methyltransferase
MPTFVPDIGGVLRHLLTHSLVRGIDPDDPRMSAAHRQVNHHKPLLRDVYEEWYAALAAHVGAARPVLEIGSGPGYLADYIPGLLSSDERPTPATRIVLDAHHLPFGRGALGAIAMTIVEHHLPNVRAFFEEAGRAVKPGGVLAAIEPWVTPWSSWVYRSLHQEPFDPEESRWEFAAGGSLSVANGALPWILFVRDRSRFERECPQWRVELVRPGWPLRYLLSGGVSLRSLTPGSARGLLLRLDRCLERRAAQWAMFSLVVLRRRDG